MKRLLLLLVLASLLAACESNAGPHPRYNRYDDPWLECEKVKTGWAAGSDYPCAH